MKPTFIIFLLFALLIVTPSASQVVDTVYSPLIKTVLFAPASNPLSQPVITLQKGDVLQLSFDELAEQPHNFYYKFVHCDQNFNPDDLEPYEFINGFNTASVSAHEFSFTTLQPYIHYTQTIPAPYLTFLASGNYALYLYCQSDSGGDDSLVLTRRFYVTEDILTSSIDIERSPSNINQNQHVSVVVSTSEPANAHFLNPTYLTARIIQNQRPDLMRTLPFSGYDAGRLVYRFHDENHFPGGNCFRYFDISNMNTPMYNVQHISSFGGELIAIIKPEEIQSHKSFILQPSLNGGMKVNVWDRNHPETEADYVHVTLTLPAQYPYLDGSVHVFGQLTGWTLGESSRMDWNPKLKSYILHLYLKQGYYAYQLLFIPAGGASEESYTSRLEGDHSLTPNTYTLFLYSRQPGERYFRLLHVSSAQYQ